MSATADREPLLPDVVEFGEFRLDLLRCRLQRNGELIRLGAKPCELLACLIQNSHRTVSAEYLLESVWHNSLGDPNLVQQNIRQIRLVIEVNPKEPQWVVTIPGQGYRFVGPLSFPEQETESVIELKPGTNGLDHAEAVHSGNNKVAGTTKAIVPSVADSSTTNLVARQSRIRYASLMVLVAAVVAFYLYSSAPGEPSACEVSVNTLIVKDGQGREVWSREFREHLDARFYAEHPPLCQFVDLDHDGIADVLFASKIATSNIEGDMLYGLITPPKLLRALRASPRRVLTFRAGTSLLVGPNSDPKINREYDEYLPPWDIVNFFSTNVKNGDARIVVSSGMGQAPDQVAVLDGQFRKLGEYWHAGVLEYGQFDTYNGHDRIFLGGVNNGYRSATVVVFDPANVNGTSDLSLDLPDRTPKFAILATGTRGHLKKLGVGTETCRVLFERTCIAKAKPHREPYNRVTDFRVTPGRIFVTVAEGEKKESRLRVVYEMDRHFNLVEAGPTTEFQQRHMELERAGLLDHPFSMDELKPLVHVLPGCEFAGK